MYAWRDPITYALHMLEKGPDFEINCKIFKIMRARLYDSFRAFVKVPGMIYNARKYLMEGEIKTKMDEIGSLNDELGAIDKEGGVLQIMADDKKMHDKIVV